MSGVGLSERYGLYQPLLHLGVETAYPLDLTFLFREESFA